MAQPTLIVKIGANVDAFKKAVNDASTHLDRVGDKLQSVGARLSVGLTAPIVAAGGAAFKFASEFERDMTRVVTLSQVSERNMQAFRQSILDLAPAVGVGPGELARGMLAVTSTGIRGAEAMDILEMSAKGAAVGLGETETVARTITSAVNAYGKENLTAARAADILFQTVVEGNAEASTLAPVLGRVMGIASQMGVTFEEVGASIATFTRLGVGADVAVTSLRDVLSQLLNPSAKARETMEALGFSAAQLRAEIREKGLADTLIHLMEVTGGNVEVIGEMIGDVRGLAAVLGTAGAQGDTYQEVLGKISAATNVVNQAHERVKETSAYTWASLKANIESAAIAFGNDLAPSLKQAMEAAQPLVEAAKDLAHWFADLPKPVQTLAIAGAALAASIGPMAWGLGTVLKTASAIGLLFSGGAGLGPLAFLANPYVLGGAVVLGGIALAWKTIGDNMERAKRQMSGETTIGQIIPGTMDAEGKHPLFSIADAQKQATPIGDVTKGYSTILSGFGNAQAQIRGLGGSLEGLTKKGKEFQKVLSEIMQNEASPPLATFTDALQGLGTAIPQDFFDDVVKARTETLRLEAASREPLRRFTNVLQDLGEVVPQDFFDDIAKVRSEVIKLESDTGASLENIGQRFVPTIEDLNTVFSRTDKIVVSVSKSLEKVPELLIAGFTGGGNIKGALSGLATDITGGLFGAKGPLGGVTKAVGGAVSGALGGALGSTMSGIIGSAVSGILPGIGALAAPLLGKLFSIGGPSKEELSARDQQAQLVEQLGRLATAAQQTEIALAKGSDAYKTLAVVGRDAMRAIGQSAAEADIVVQGLLDTHHPERFKAAMAEVQAALQLQGEAQQALTDALGRYKFSIEELGPALAGQRLSEQSQQLYQDWQVLTQAGVDVTAVAREMSGATSEYIQTALQMGIEVPAAMRPMIQAMIDQGVLTDAAGLKITSLEESGITFATTMTEGFKSVVESVQQLTDVLRRGLGLAVEETAAKIKSIPTRVDVEMNLFEHRIAAEGSDYDLPHMAEGGIVSRPTIAMIGEAGPEAVVPLSRTGGASTVSEIELHYQELQAEVAGLRRDFRQLPTDLAIQMGAAIALQRRR